MYDEYKVNIPTGKSNDWTVEKFEVTEKQAELERLRSLFNGGRGVPAGHYTALKRNGHIIMSDTSDEIRDHFPIIHKVKGQVLINGLGLGVVIKACLNNPNVFHVTVIEKSLDVITLVGNHYKKEYGNKLTVIHADAFEYKPPIGMRFDVVWHDIWDNICTDNLPEMHKLHRKYGRRADW